MPATLSDLHSIADRPCMCTSPRTAPWCSGRKGHRGAVVGRDTVVQWSEGTPGQFVRIHESTVSNLSAS